MDLVSLHEKLAGVLPTVVSGGDVAEVEVHASQGCSRCARALVDARDAAAAVAEVGSFPVRAPARDILRERVLRGGSAALSARKGSPARRFFDPAGEVARLHVGGPGDAERAAEIDALALAAPSRSGRDTCRVLLEELRSVVRFPLLFVSVVRGERVGYRAQVGLDAFAGESTSADRRRETTFCTHTVSMGAPMIVCDAAREPFFRGSRMVLRDGIAAYVGVPVQSARGVVVGTVCAMDVVPRAIGPEVVRAVELFAEAVAAEIERARGGPGLPRVPNGLPLHPEAWFRELIGVTAAPKAVVVAPRAASPALVDLARAGEPLGVVDERHALLVAAATGDEAALGARCGELVGAVRGAVVLRGAYEL